MMARKADKDQVRADLAGPDYGKGIAIIRDRVNAKKLTISKLNGEISGLWGEVEKIGINPEGAKIFARLDKLEEVDRNDVIRTIQGMSAAAGWDQRGDMLDQAENNLVQFPTPAPKPAAEKPKGKGKAGKEAEAAPPPPAGDSDLNPDDVLDRGEYIQKMADHLMAHSNLTAEEAHAHAVGLFEGLGDTDPGAPRTAENAVANAQRELDSWPEEGAAQ